MTIRELIEQGLPTDTLEVRLRELFKTDKALIAKLDKLVESESEEKREVLRELYMETYICDLILASHMHEAR
mgnify:CR=1 FL=1